MLRRSLAQLYSLLRIKSLILTFLMVSLLPSAQASPFQYLIKAVLRVRLEASTTAPQTLYRFIITRLDGNGKTKTESAKYRYEEIAALMKRMQKTRPENMEGLSFVRTEDSELSPLAAFEAEMNEAKFGFNSLPSTYKELFERTIEAFSKMEIPDFGSSDRKSVAHLADELFYNPKQLDRLIEEIKEYSKNKVTLEKSSVDEFSDLPTDYRIYLKLSNGDVVRRIVLSPQITDNLGNPLGTPFTCSECRSNACDLELSKANKEAFKLSIGRAPGTNPKADSTPSEP